MMSATNQNEPIILTVVRNDNDITIRIDQNSWAFDSFQGLPVVEMNLTGCREAGRVYDGETDSVNEPLGEVLAELTNSVDLSLYYEVSKKADEFIISLQVNYSADELRLQCAQMSETSSDYTIEELKRKTTRLAQLYQSSAQANELGDCMYHLLKNTLEKMISKEFDRYDRKIEFLDRTNLEKAATLRGEVQAYQKVLAVIGLGEVDGKPLAPQLREWLQRIDDDHIENQLAYARSVESRIADLGQAALFPLLEMIKDADRGYQREVIMILGMIDPNVQGSLMDILHFDDIQPE